MNPGGQDEEEEEESQSLTRSVTHSVSHVTGRSARRRRDVDVLLRPVTRTHKGHKESQTALKMEDE